MTVIRKTVGILSVLWLVAMFSGSYAVPENNNYYLPLTNIAKTVCPWGFGDKGQAGVPGPIEILNLNSVPIISGDDDTSPIRAVVCAASQAGNGRIVGLGHDGFFINGALSLYDNKQFGVNIINWLEGTQNKKKILVTTGHGEPWVGNGDYDEFFAELRNKGFSINTFSGTITSARLSDVSVLFISCPGPSLSDVEIDAIKNFVSAGGGLFVQGLGWAWLSYEKRPLEEYPLNKLAMEYGIKWIGGYISDPTNNRNGCPVFHRFFPETVNNYIKKITSECSNLMALSDAKVTPGCGPENSEFTFSVVYKDPEGGEPTSNIWIQGWEGSNQFQFMIAVIIIR